MVADDDVTERILRVTLEIIYLLTGEDYGPQNKSADAAILNTSSGMSRRQGRNQRKMVIHKRTHEQKILDLTNEIIELLTGEVPVRCQDVTVHLSMEEWEYLEEHKDLYKDIMIEDNQSLKSPVEFVLSGCSPTHIKEEHVTKDDARFTNVSTATDHSPQDPYLDVKQEILCGGRNLQGTDICTSIDYTDYVSFLIKDEAALDLEETPSETSKSSSHNAPYLADHFKKDTISQGQGEDLKDTDICTAADRTRHYPPSHIKDGILSYNEENSINSYTTTDPPQLCPTYKKEPLSHQQRKLTNIYIPQSHSQYVSTCMKKESISCDEEELMEADINMPSGPTQRDLSPMNEAEVSGDGENRISPNIYTPTEHLPRYTSGHARDQPKNGLELWSKPNLFSCSECDKVFNCKSELLMHLPIHSGDKPYNCSICGKCFTNLSYLINHGKIHAGEKRYSCPDCGVSFTRKSNLKAHKRKHTGEKPYLCSDCGKSFTSNSNLNAHRKTHTGDKPYSCPDCGKSFITRSHLVVHRRTHTGEKPYTCPLCIKCFSSTSDLAKHRKIHNKKPYYCSKCGKCYKSNPDFDNQKLHICNS